VGTNTLFLWTCEIWCCCRPLEHNSYSLTLRDHELSCVVPERAPFYGWSVPTIYPHVVIMLCILSFGLLLCPVFKYTGLLCQASHNGYHKCPLPPVHAPNLAGPSKPEAGGSALPTSAATESTAPAALAKQARGTLAPGTALKQLMDEWESYGPRLSWKAEDDALYR
jgi:hypothetical protein